MALEMFTRVAETDIPMGCKCKWAGETTFADVIGRYTLIVPVRDCRFHHSYYLIVNSQGSQV